MGTLAGSRGLKRIQVVTWKGIRGTLFWMVLLLLIGVISAGAVAARLWSAKDDLIFAAIQERFTESLPDCLVDFEAVRFMDSGHLEITHLLLRSRENGNELLRVPRIVIELETNMLRVYRRLVIRELLVQSPELILLRDANSRWNWEGIRLAAPKSTVCPRWSLKNGTVRLGCVSVSDGKVRTLTLQGIQVSLQPESFQRYTFTGTSVAESLGPIQVVGVVDSRTGEWNLHGAAGEIRVSDPLLDLAGRFTPLVQQQLARMRETNAALLAQTQENLASRTAAVNDVRPVARTDESNSSLLRADLAIQFAAHQGGKGAPVYYDLQGNIGHGHISDALLPVPLYDLEGRFRINPDVIEIHNLKAANGPSTLLINGIAKRTENDWSKEFQVRVTQLKLDERIRSFLWGTMAKVYDMLSPSGTFDVDVELSQQPGQPFTYSLNKFAVIDCRVLCDYFRLPAEQVNGNIRQRGSAFDLEMTGRANGFPFDLTGTIDLKNPERDVSLQITAANVRYDDSIKNALQRPEQQLIRKVLESLHLQGHVDKVVVDIIRGNVTEGKVAIGIQGEVSDGTLKYTQFPYEVNNLKGTLNYNPLKRNTWYFENVSGTHGPARITGRGFYDLEDGPGALALEMAVLQAPLDQDLEKASSTASPSLATAWSDFGIKGSVDVDKISVSWSEESKLQVALDGIHWNNGQFMAAVLPYIWNNVSGTLAWSNNRLKIHSLQGDHNGTYLLINGAVANSAFVEIEPSPDVAWRMFLDERILHLMKLNPDDELKRAIPTVIADALKAVDLKSPVDLSLGMEMKGWLSNRNLVTASWSALAAFKDNSLNIGVPISGVTGNIVHRGSWDGQHLQLEGYAELDTLKTLDLSIRKARGPFLLRNNRLTLGSPKLSGNEPVYHQSNPYHREQLRADVYGGQIGLDIDVSLAGSTSAIPYQLELTVNDAELGEWAREHEYNKEKLMGKVNGVLQLSGKGANPQLATGQGWIQITPAALMEVPVFAQIFTVLSFRPARPGDAMFKYAYGDFTIHDSLFDFTKIELWGDVISLVGQGAIAFAGPRATALDLDFYSTANNRIPFLGPLVRAVSDRWIRVQVTGTTSQPVARIQQRIPYLNDAFAGFMQSLESGQTQRTPPRQIQR